MTTAPTLVGATAPLATGINSAAKDTQIALGLVGEATATTGGLGTVLGTANTFVTYTATGGLRPLNLTDEYTQNAITAATNVRTTAATAMAASTAINSLVINGATAAANTLTLTGTLTDTSGMLLFAPTANVASTITGGTVAFGTREGVIYAGGTTGTAQVIASAVTGSNGLTVSGPGSVTLSGTVTLSGGTLGVPQHFLTLSGSNNLSGAAVSVSANGGIPAFFDVDALTNTGSISAVLAGGGALTKTGAGTATLTGANTYAGGTTVSAGTLLVNNTAGSGTGSGALSVANGAVLAGTGSANAGASAITLNGTLAPGASSAAGVTGNFTLASTAPTAGLTFGGASTFAFDINTAGDKDLLSLGAGTTVSLGGTLALNLGAGFDYTATYTVITGISGTAAGAFDSVTGYDTADYTAVLNETAGGDYNLSFTPTAVPEPATWLGGLLLAGVLGSTRRRRLSLLWSNVFSARREA